MKFDANQHRCSIIIDKDLPTGFAINAASVIGISLGRTVDNLVGPDRQSIDAINYPGVIYSPLPVLLAPNNYIHELHNQAEHNDKIYVMPFSALAQSCKTYEEYSQRISSINSHNIKLVAIGLIGPKKQITKMIGNLPLYK